MSRTVAASTVARESSPEESHELAFERSSEEPDVVSVVVGLVDQATLAAYAELVTRS